MQLVQVTSHDVDKYAPLHIAVRVGNIETLIAF